MSRYVILEAPSVLGLRPTGVEQLPQTLIELGLAERLDARVAGRIEPPDYDPERDPETRMLNPRAIRDYSVMLADAVGSILDEGHFPVVVGGDCSILLGNLLALRRRGRYGLLFVDGHADFYQPEVNPNGEAASMDLAFATGHGPRLLADIEGCGPLVRPEDAVAFGFRDAEEQAHYGSQPLAPAIRAFDLAAVRRLGADAAARSAVNHVAREGLEGFFIHVDADSLDDDIMPAVDYRLPGGLSLEELRTTLEIAVSNPKAVGMEITVYNPVFDKDGTAGRALVDVLVEALGSSASSRQTAQV